MKKLIAIAITTLALAFPAAVSADTWTTVYANQCTGATGASSHLLFLSRNAPAPVVGSPIYAFGDSCIVATVWTSTGR